MGVDFKENISEGQTLYSFHEVEDGIALDDFVITKDMPLTKRKFGGNYLLEFNIPNYINDQPVVELSIDFHKSANQKYADHINYDKIAETLVIPQNLKRIRCPLGGRGIKNVIVSPDNTMLIFDEYAWYEDGGKTIVSTWSSNFNVALDSIKEYTIRDGTIQACAEVKQEFTLEKLVFPDSFTIIHENFLKTGWSLGKKSTVEKIFANYDSCMRKYAEEIEAEFIALDRQDVIFSDDRKTLISCPQIYSETTYIVPNTVSTIKEYAFKGNEGIKEIIIPDSVVEIGKGAFSECVALETVILSDSISVLPEMIFADCKKLKTVKFPSHLVTIEKKSFSNTALENITLPETVVEIGDYAFGTVGWFREEIKSIELPKSVRKIGLSVCAGIKDITIYDSIDPDAKPAKDYCDGENGTWNSSVGCIGIRQYEGYLWGACNSEVYDHTITVKSAVDGSVKYVVLMYAKKEYPEQLVSEAKNVCYVMVSSWGKNADFNFEKLDGIFDKLKVLENKYQTAINRLEYPVELTDETREKYLSWLKRNGLKVATYLIESRDIEKILILGKYNVFSKSNIDKLISLSSEKGLEEVTAYLVQYKSKL